MNEMSPLNDDWNLPQQAPAYSVSNILSVFRTPFWGIGMGEEEDS